MKNHKEFRDAVFAKAAAHEKQRKLKRQKALRTALSVCACLAVFTAVAAFPFGMIVGNMDEAAEMVTTTLPDNAGTGFPLATTEATTAATTETATTCTTVAYTQTTTIATTCTTAAYTQTTTAATTRTTTAHTYASTTTAATSTAALTETTDPSPTTFPEQLLEDYYHNGVMTLHVTTGYGYSDDCHIANVDTVFAYSGLSDATAKYFDEEFFEKNALIRIRYTLGDVGSRLNYAGMQAEDGKITVFLDFDKSQSENGDKLVVREMLVPISADVARGAVIVTDVEEK